MMHIKTVIIEDEQKSVLVLTDLVKRLAHDLEVVGSASYVQEAANLLEETSPDLVFMDVRLADGPVLTYCSSCRFVILC